LCALLGRMSQVFFFPSVPHFGGITAAQTKKANQLTNQPTIPTNKE